MTAGYGNDNDNDGNSQNENVDANDFKTANFVFWKWGPKSEVQRAGDRGLKAEEN